ncbi:MAG: hypothetical protein POELPBGB_00205 [Bacteroidia bacterium]|nr:hypothetical protein [Bacteroidia bacterium]
MTTNQPDTGDFLYLKVKSINAEGVTMILNSEGGEVFIPHSEQRQKMETGNSYVVVLQEKTEKGFTGSGKTEDFLDRDVSELKVNQQVDLLVTRYTQIGMSCIINSRYAGLLYSNEVFRDINPGDKVKGYIKKITDDGKVDVALQKQGVAAIADNTIVILEQLKKHKGFLPLSDSSQPGEIYDALGISKKLFKKAIGTLYKQKLIELKEDGIKLVGK